MNKKYYYIVMSQKDMLQNQVLEEILRERATYYISKKRTLDFWITISSEFLEDDKLKKKIKLTNFYNQQKDKINYKFQNKESDFYATLISTDQEFLRWIKLRLGYFENIDEEIKMEEKRNYVSDGVSGVLIWENEKLSPLKSRKNYLHPDIIVNNYKKALEVYYSNTF
jgi:hypothetical protein